MIDMSFAMMKGCFALCLKKFMRGTDGKDWLKYPIYLQYVNLLKDLNFSNHSF